jgi:transposase
MKNRYVKLTSSEEKLLKALKKEGLTERIRDRSQALLLSSKGFSVKDLSTIFEVRRETILDWYNRWERDGIAGLSDALKSGRPRIFNETEEKKF